MKQINLLLICSYNFTAIGEMDVELDDVVLSDSGAAGAFIHGLEDEYEEVSLFLFITNLQMLHALLKIHFAFKVRIAAVDSVCELSLRSPQLASRAVEYLVDILVTED